MRHYNHKLGRAIDVPDEGDTDDVYTTYEADYRTVATCVTRKEAFDWLQGKDRATQEVARAEKLRIVREKLQADVDRMLETCETDDGWLEHLYHDRNRHLTVTPICR